MPRRKAVHPQPLKRPGEEAGEGDVEEATPRPATTTTASLSIVTSSSASSSLILASESNTPSTSTSLPSEGAGEPLRRSTRTSSNKELASPSTSQTHTTPTSKGGRGNVKKTPIKKSKNVEVPTSMEIVSSKGADNVRVVKDGPDGETASAADAGNDEKRNLSLEALFQVTHSELENMSRRQKTPASPQKVAPKISPQADAKPIQSHENLEEKSIPPENVPPVIVEEEEEAAPLVVAEEEATETDHTVSYVIQVAGDGEMTEHGYKLITLPASEELIIESSSSSATPVRASPAHSPAARIHLPVQSHSLEEQNLQVSYTTQDAGAFTYTSQKRPIMKAYSEGDVTPESRSVMPSINRKRKPFTKPGRHVCNYCGRGCTKPSVLQKHIRAHTGERPYPCLPCGFSFKTKSNLYKHCKSRAHAIKAGQSAPTSSEDIGRLDSIDAVDESDDDNTSASASSDHGLTPERTPFGSPNAEVMLSTKPVMHRMASTPILSTFKSEVTAPPSSSATAKVVMTDSQYYDVEYAKDGAVPGTSTPLATSQPSTSAEIVSDNQMKVTIKLESTKKETKAVTSAERHTALTPHIIPPRIQPLDPKSPMTPEMLKERISQIISANSAIIDTPLADAPRPKRMSRQNSEVASSQPAPSSMNHTLARMMSAPCFDTTQKKPGQPSRVSSLTPSPAAITQSASLDPYQVQNIVKVAQLAVASSAGVAPPTRTLTAPAGAAAAAAVSTPTSLPQEIKIQIKLPKPSSSPAPPIRSVATPMTHPQVLSQTTLLGQQAFLPAGQVLLTPTIQPGRNHNPNSSSMVKDLLLQSKATPTSSKSHYISNIIKQHTSTPDGGVLTPQPPSTPSESRFVQLMEAPGSEPSSQPQVVYVTQEMMPMQVAQQVEITAKEADQKQRSFVRSLSVPITMAAPLTPSSSVPNLTFDHYDPLTPPKRGRPKGSRNLPKESPVQDTTISPLAQELRKMPVVSDSMKGVFKLPMFNAVSPVNLVPTTGGPHNLKLKIPPRTLTAFSHSNTATPMVTPSVGQYLSLTPSVTCLTPGMTPAVTPSILPSGSSVPNLLTPGTPSLSTLLNSPLPQQETPTTQSLCKLKLKGKILMKRSMSVEKMLSQEKEKERADNRALSNVKISELLRRSQSVDDSMHRKREDSNTAPVGDHSSIIAKLLKQQRQLGPSPLAAVSSVQMIPTTAPMITSIAETKVMVLTKSEDGRVHWEPSRAKVEVLMPNSVQMMPTNKAMPIIRPGAPTLSPHLSSSKNYSSKLHLIPTLLLDKFNEADSQEVNQNERRVRERDESETTSAEGEPPAKKRRTDGGDDKNKISKVDVKSGATGDGSIGEQDRSQSEAEASVSSSDKKGLSSEAEDVEGMEWEPSMPEKLIKKVVIPGLPNVPVTVSDVKTEPLMLKDLPEKQLGAHLLLLAHAYPILRNQTHTTFCSVVKPQPMYVAQAGNQKLSMYSNWRSATYNPNPMGLSSKELMELYHSRWYDVEPLYASAGGTSQKDSILTHSSYWQYQGDSPATSNQEEMSTAAVHEVSEVVRLTNEMRSTIDDVPIQPVTVQIITTPVKSHMKDVANSKEPKRVQLFAGGYKSNEDYTYVRGRGRGKYVCEECGIRCKKPSMLKKHIRTHTDLRPYHCSYCSFSFKTKGNLTKHMKSKTHHKHCYELGIIPVPVDVTDDHIDKEALAKQVALAKQSHILGMGDDSTLDDDDDDEDEEDDIEGGSLDVSLDASVEQDVEEEGPVEQNMDEVIVIDKAGEIIQTLNTENVSGLTGEKVSGDGPWYVAIQEPDSVQPTFVCIEQNSQPHTTAEEVVVATEDTAATPNKDKGGDKLRPSIDKEIAHSLLDLSKAPDTQPPSPEPEAGAETSVAGSSTKPKLRRQQSVGGSEEGASRQTVVSGDDDGTANNQQVVSTSDDSAHDSVNNAEACRLSGLIGELMSRTVKSTDSRSTSPGVSTAVTTLTSTTTTLSVATSPLPTATASVTEKVSEAQSTASSVAMTMTSISQGIQSFLESKGISISTSTGSPSKSGTSHGTPVKYMGAGFVPPVLFTDSRETVVVNEPSVGSSQVPKVDVSPVPLVFPGASSASIAIASVEGGLPEPDQEGNAAAQVIEAQIVTNEISMEETPLISSGAAGLSFRPSTVHTTGTIVTSSAYSQSLHSSFGNLSHRPIISATVSPATRITKSNVLPSVSSNVHMLQLHGSPGVAPASIPVGVKIIPVTSTSKLNFATGENKAPYEIIPIPGKVTDNRESLVDGMWVCNVCGKVFSREPQLTLHQNIHLLEKPYRCEDCTLSFRTKALLQKHQKSEGHMAKLSVNQQFGAPSSDNPRPYKCDDCGVAFRIYGHLAKHVRSKLHITTLEKLGVLPPGSFAQMESSGQLHADSKDDSGSESSSARSQGQGHVLQGQPQLASIPQPTSSLPQNKDSSRKTVASLLSREQFPYHHGYERDVHASNERVTVEIQSELIDIGDISSRGENFVEKFDVERNKAATKGKSEDGNTAATASSSVSITTADTGGATVSSPITAPSAAAHKCGICGLTFKEIIALKQHLVSHAELRPYVCEYCDAGFTRAQALQFHLRTHIQERPYLCGECGETFVSTDHLQNHSLTCVVGNRGIKEEATASRTSDALDDKSHLSTSTGITSPAPVFSTQPSTTEVPETMVEFSEVGVDVPPHAADVPSSTDSRAGPSPPTIVIDQALKQQITQLIRENPGYAGKIQVVDVETSQIRDIQVDPTTGDIVLLGLAESETIVVSNSGETIEQQSAVASIDAEGNNNDSNKGDHEKVQLPVVDTKVGLIETLPEEFSVVHADTGVVIENIPLTGISAQTTAINTEIKRELRPDLVERAPVENEQNSGRQTLHSDGNFPATSDLTVETALVSSDSVLSATSVFSSPTGAQVDAPPTKTDNPCSADSLHSNSAPDVANLTKTTSEQSFDSGCGSGVEENVKIGASPEILQASESPVSESSELSSHHALGHGRLLRKQLRVDDADGTVTETEEVISENALEVPLIANPVVPVNIEQSNVNPQPGETTTSGDRLEEPIVKGYPGISVCDSSQSDNEAGLVIAMETSNSQSDQEEMVNPQKASASASSINQSASKRSNSPVPASTSPPAKQHSPDSRPPNPKPS